MERVVGDKARESDQTTFETSLDTLKSQICISQFLDVLSVVCG